MTATTTHAPPKIGGRASNKAIAGWLLFDWAAQPYFALITTFIFAPYFANHFVDDKVTGQAYWGYAAAVAGIIIAIASPIAGSIADVTGRRKIWVFGLSIIFMTALFGLWNAEPGPNAPILLILALVIVTTVCSEMQIVFTNAIMPTLVPREQLGRLSGIGWAAGYAGGLLALILFAGGIAVIPETGKTMLGLAPFIDLDTSRFEAERLSGPLCALWFLIFSIPFFLWTPDGRKAKMEKENHSFSGAVATGLKELGATFKSLGHYKNIALFLVSRLFYIDGLAAIFVFGGIYGTAIFDWSSTEIGLFGIIITIAATIGALAGGPLDDNFGPKPVILIALLGLIIGVLGVLSIDPNHILFFIQVEPKANDGSLFESTGEQFYILFGMLIGIVSGPIYAASRTLLAHLAPEEKLTQFYGLYAFSGKVTTFAAPLIVAYVTDITQNQRAGVAPILVFIIIGLILLMMVKDERTSK